MKPVSISVQISFFIKVVLLSTAVYQGFAATLYSVDVTSTSPARNGSVAHLDCRLNESTVYPFAVSWRRHRDPKPIHTYRPHQFNSSRGNLAGRAFLLGIRRGFYQLLINPVLVGDEGIYWCEVYEDMFTSKSGATELKINVLPETPKMMLSNNTFKEYQNVTMTCKGNVGRPGGRIRWWRKGAKEFKEIRGMMLKNISLPDGTAYQISAYFTMFTRIDQRAIYRCTAENDELRPDETPPYAEFQAYLEGYSKKSSKDEEESFHVAGLFSLAMAGVGIIGITIYCVRRHRKINHCPCMKKKEKQPTIATVATVSLTRNYEDEPDAEETV
ncbi:uncharacterized protein LOC141907892 [Tubulanus polymorphus]|uniref:uncharacterized protein LOC141907892 n=1 Tax=Tubulanus polymorphus TaxID=672921 RepID=UPI003DA48FF3